MCLCAHMYVRMYVGMHVCLHACLFVDIHLIPIYLLVFIDLFSPGDFWYALNVLRHMFAFFLSFCCFVLMEMVMLPPVILGFGFHVQMLWNGEVVMGKFVATNA